MVMILFPLPVSSALLLEIRASRRCLASIGELSAAPEDAPMRAIFSAIADSMTPGSDELSSERISSRSKTIVWTFPASHEYPSGTPLTTIVSVPKGVMSNPSFVRIPALSSKIALLAAPTSTLTGNMFACVDGPDFDGHKVDWDLAVKRNQMYKDFEAHKYEETCNLFKKEAE